jgi:hypothetical protein
MKNFFNKYVRLPLWLVTTVALAVSSYGFGRVLEFNYAKNRDYSEDFVYGTKYRILESFVNMHPWTSDTLSPITKEILYKELSNDWEWEPMDESKTSVLDH